MNAMKSSRHAVARLVLACVFVSSFALSCAADDRAVYVTQSGTKYHRESCSALNRSKIPLSLDNATGKGYLPCGICHPPVLEERDGETPAVDADVSAVAPAIPEKRDATISPGRNFPFTVGGTVVSVTDGDTVIVIADGARLKIRLNGIDCPERKQAYGQKAKEFSLSFAAQKNVSVTVRDIDRYGRYVGDVIVDGVSLNERLVEAGLAWHYRQYSDDATLARLENEAREAGRGLWKDANPVAPWDFRKGKK
jgi:endonuclease YncB( thermonuclease family)